MTPHIEAAKEDIAKIVIMPGDPLRAKYIAENFLENVKQVNAVRNMLGYTGFYNGKKVTVMGSGMGMASIGIYSYELYKFYDVDAIIRIGTCGAYADELDLLDVLLVDNAYTDSSFALVQSGKENNLISSSKELNNAIKQTADKLNLKIFNGTVHSSDVFYSDYGDFKELNKNQKCLAVEMESFALFHNASVLNKKAACILTVSNSFVKEGELSPEEREKALNDMITLALETNI